MGFWLAQDTFPPLSLIIPDYLPQVYFFDGLQARSAYVSLVFLVIHQCLHNQQVGQTAVEYNWQKTGPYYETPLNPLLSLKSVNWPIKLSNLLRLITALLSKSSLTLTPTNHQNPQEHSYHCFATLMVLPDSIQHFV